MKKSLLLLLTLALLLCACAAEPEPQAAPSAGPVPTAAPEATAAPTPQPTVVPTPQPEAAQLSISLQGAQHLSLLQDGKFDTACALPAGGTITVTAEEEIARVEPLFRACGDRSERFGTDLRRNLSFLELLITIGELTADNRDDREPRETENSRNYDRVKPVISYILEHPTENMSLDSIAARFNYNKHYLCRVFKTATGISVGKYVMSVRIQYAATCLRHGCSVQESGAMAGYRNNSNFISTFRKAMGISPGQYRQQYRQRFGQEDEESEKN